MKYHQRLLFLLFILFLFSVGFVALVPEKITNQNNTTSNQTVTPDNEPFAFYTMGPNGQLPKEMTSRTPPELHPSPSGNTILLTDNFDNYKTELELINSPWDFSEPANTHSNLKESKTLAASGKRCVEFYDNNATSNAQMYRSFSAGNHYLYVKAALYANQTTGSFFVAVYGSGGYFYIRMGVSSNAWYIGTNGVETATGSTYVAKQWYTIELFANVLKNTYDFYVNNHCLASNVTFFSKGATNLNLILFCTGVSDASNSRYYYVDDVEVAIPPKIIYLLVKFSDKANSNSVNTMYQKIFTNDGSLRNYYKENSFNKFTIAGTVTNWLMMPNTMVWYGDGRNYQLTLDSLSSANPTVDFSIYDHVIIVHAGDDEAESHVTTDIWSACYPPSSSYYVGPYDGVYIDHICWVSELTGIGVACHEFGHMLDLPDLYDTGLPSGDPDDFVGDWALMGSGSWNGASAGSSPAHMMAWDKIKLGWLPSENIETIATDDWANGVYLYPLEISTSKEQVIKIEISTNHYYLVENRLQTGFDTYLPDQGIIITYIDETLGSGAGIVKVKNSHPGSTNLDLAAWDLSGASEWQVFRDITRKIYVTVGTESGNVYLMYEEQFPTGNRTYYTYTIAANSVMYWDISMTAGQILLWDWLTSGSVDFRILRPSDSAEWEFISGVDHDGGVFRAPTTDSYQFRVRNTNLISSRTIHIYLISYTNPQLGIYEFTNLESPIYRTNQFTLRLQVRDTGGSLVEGVTATLNLPPGLNLVDGWERTINIEDLGYYEYATAYWEVYASSTGSKSVQVVMASTWGGAPTQNRTFNIILDTTPPELYSISPTPYNDSLVDYNDISIVWSVYDYETNVKTTSIFLNTTFITNTTATSYDFTDLPDGLYYCRLIAYDLENNQATEVIVFQIDTHKPSRVKITAPLAGKWYTNDIKLNADVYDSGCGIYYVEFYQGDPKAGGTLIGTDYSGVNGWSYIWWSDSSDNGANTLYIRAYDLLGHYNDSSGVLINVDNSLPTIPICTSIDPYTVYSGNISIVIQVEDSLSGIGYVEFWLGYPGSGGILLYNDSNPLNGWNYTWSTTEDNDGTNSIYIRAFDKCGNENDLWVYIKVKNEQTPSNFLFFIILIAAIAACSVVSVFFIVKSVRKKNTRKQVSIPKTLKEPPMARPVAPPPPAMARPVTPPPPAMARPVAPPPPAMARPVSSPPRLSAITRPVAPPPISPITETQKAPIDTVPIYRCPRCSAPLPAETIENLKTGQIDLCSSCKTRLTGDLIFSIPKQQSAVELLQGNLVKAEVSTPPPEETSESPTKLSDKEVEELLAALHPTESSSGPTIESLSEPATEPPSESPIQKESSASPPSSFEETIKSLETKIQTKTTQPAKYIQPIIPIQPIQPVQVPPVVEYTCPYCNNALPPQKISNLQKGINVICPNCLKSIQHEIFSKKEE